MKNPHGETTPGPAFLIFSLILFPSRFRHRYSSTGSPRSACGSSGSFLCARPVRPKRQNSLPQKQNPMKGAVVGPSIAGSRPAALRRGYPDSRSSSCIPLLHRFPFLSLWQARYRSYRKSADSAGLFLPFRLFPDQIHSLCCHLRKSF